MLLFNDLFPGIKEVAQDNGCKRIKVRFNQPTGGNDPIEVFKKDREIINTQWLLWRKKQYYFRKDDLAICLVQLKQDRDLWLLTTMKRINSVLNVANGVAYESTELKKYESFYGRVIIKYHKSTQSQDRLLDNIKDSLEISEILPDVFDDDYFPGYDRVSLSYLTLKAILDRGKQDWINALQNQKAVYLITDINNGCLYVGSATSNHGMLLDRWKTYLKNGHGGNKELKKVVERYGFDYVKHNFQYSILENFNANTADGIVLDREKYWKKVLDSINHGYNDN